MVPNSLLYKLSHGSHVKALKSGQVDTELCISMSAEKSADLCKFVRCPNIKRLLVRHLVQHYTRWRLSENLIVHAPSDLSQVVTVPEKLLVRLQIPDRHLGLRSPVLWGARGSREIYIARQG